MTTMLGNPSRYIQGKGELLHICRYAKELSTRIFVLCAEVVMPNVERIVSESAERHECSIVYELFSGECSSGEIERVLGVFKKSGCGIIAGIGGGKTLDTAKAAAFYAGVPVVIAPTIISTNSPCTALVALHSEMGLFDKYLYLPANPAIVLVDSGIVSKAPARLFVSGMGDALATYFEARACARSGAKNLYGNDPTLTGLTLSRLCYDILFADGIKALCAIKRAACTRAVENIIEAAAYISSIAYESCGLAAAHAIHNGLTAIKETAGIYHGEKVAFATIVQLVLENAPEDEINKVLTFCGKVGLPVTLEDLHIKNPEPDALMGAARLACAEGDTMGNLPFAVKPSDVYDAILGADALGMQRKAMPLYS